MKLNKREKAYQRQYLQQICHTTMDPRQPGVVRVHLVPPRQGETDTPYLVILNGQEILPLTFSWAVVLSSFIRHLNKYDGQKIPEDAYGPLIRDTALDVRKVYPFHRLSLFEKDLSRIVDTLVRVARGQQPNEEIAPISIFDYAEHMRAPHRMDLMVSAMADEGGRWHCNQRCVHCYAAGQPLAGRKELSTDEWKRIIDKCKDACIAQLTFTGGEPTMRSDLPELVRHAGFFMTRLNTNGILLTEDLCARLDDASLDSAQVTLYSSDREIHERLVGAPHFEDTMNGIKNALKTGINLSVNTPLCSLNRDYVKTLGALMDTGVKYFTCSGLIPTGGADTDSSRSLALEKPELLGILTEAFRFCADNGLELSFTTPGLFTDEELAAAGATQAPTCGACLSNMAVAPDGEIVPCQSWLNESLGNMLTDSFDAVWDSPRCKEIRAVSASRQLICQLDARKGADHP